MDYAVIDATTGALKRVMFCQAGDESQYLGEGEQAIEGRPTFSGGHGYFDGTAWVDVGEPETIAHSYDHSAKQWVCDKKLLADWRRGERNRLLAESDWSQGADIPTATRSIFKAYRQSLRDLPKQEGFPETIVWPIKPL